MNSVDYTGHNHNHFKKKRVFSRLRFHCFPLLQLNVFSASERCYLFTIAPQTLNDLSHFSRQDMTAEIIPNQKTEEKKLQKRTTNRK